MSKRNYKSIDRDDSCHILVNDKPLRNDIGKDNASVSLRKSQKLLFDKRSSQAAINALRFMMFSMSLSVCCLGPNYPIMAKHGAHPDSFPSTGGLGFSAATYINPMAYGIA